MNGNTEIGIETKFKNMKYPLLVNASDVGELKKMVLSEQGFEIGTGYTWTQVLELLNDLRSKVDVILIYNKKGSQKKRNRMHIEQYKVFCWSSSA